MLELHPSGPSCLGHVGPTLLGGHGFFAIFEVMNGWGLSKILVIFESFWDDFGFMLGSFWHHSGAILDGLQFVFN